MVPGTYKQWEHCITVGCKIPLTADYVAQRIAALQDPSDQHTQKFVERWGEQHLARTLGFFQEAAQRLAR